MLPKKVVVGMPLRKLLENELFRGFLGVCGHHICKASCSCSSVGRVYPLWGVAPTSAAFTCARASRRVRQVRPQTIEFDKFKAMLELNKKLKGYDF
jgi:hypothetical protein